MLNKQPQKKMPSLGIIIPAVLLSLIFVGAVIGLIMNTSDGKSDDDKLKTQDAVVISIAGATLVEDQQYNIWFDIICDETSGTLKISNTDGYLMMQNNANTDALPVVVESIDLDTIKTHSFIWIVEKSDDVQVEKCEVVFESATKLKSSSIFAGFENGTVAFLDEEQYNALMQKTE